MSALLSIDDELNRLDAALSRLESAAEDAVSRHADSAAGVGAEVVAERDQLRQKHGALVAETNSALADLDRLLSTHGAR